MRKNVEEMVNAAEERQTKAQERLLKVAELRPTPQELAERIRRYVIGQDQAVDVVATHLAIHIATQVRRTACGRPAGPRGRNLLMLGATGVGKTLILRRASTEVHLPATLADAAQLTASGYVGESPQDWCRNLINQADGDLTLASHGLLLIDEIDKRVITPGPTLDVCGGAAQDTLLRLLDGGVVSVEMQDGSGGTARRYTVPFRADRTMIMLAGAFAGIEDCVLRRLRGKRSIGFGAGDPTTVNALSPADLRQLVMPEDLVTYGLKPELVGRIGRIVVMPDLDRGSMRRILAEVPDGPCDTLRRIADDMGFRLEFPPKLLDAIVDMAAASGLGARGLFTYASMACSKALLEVPTYVKKMGRNVPIGCTVVQLRSDSIRNGYYAIRHELPYSHKAMEIPEEPSTRARRAARGGG